MKDLKDRIETVLVNPLNWPKEWSPSEKEHWSKMAEALLPLFEIELPEEREVDVLSAYELERHQDLGYNQCLADVKELNKGRFGEQG